MVICRKIKHNHKNNCKLAWDWRMKGIFHLSLWSFVFSQGHVFATRIRLCVSLCCLRGSVLHVSFVGISFCLVIGGSSAKNLKVQQPIQTCSDSEEHSARVQTMPLLQIWLKQFSVGLNSFFFSISSKFLFWVTYSLYFSSGPVQTICVSWES